MSEKLQINVKIDNFYANFIFHVRNKSILGFKNIDASLRNFKHFEEIFFKINSALYKT